MQPVPSHLDRLNYVNIGLMLGSAALACVLPFEVFLAAYAILGPLHYLTQISWLHDRGYFTTGRWDWVPLALLGVVSLEAAYGHRVGWHGSSFAALALGVVAAFVANPAVKIATLVTCVALAGPVHEWFPARLFFGVLLTTVVHVYLFTGLFILAGSMKSRSRSGYASLAVYLACGIGLLLAQPHDLSTVGVRDPEPRFLRRGRRRDGAARARERRASGDRRDRTLPRVRVHVSLPELVLETGIIRWHEISGARMAGIGRWLASVGLYAYDYAIGLAALFFLSIVHVFLEFPLDARTLVDVLAARRRPAPVAVRAQAVRRPSAS
jgi:hypothetical protein